MVEKKYFENIIKDMKKKYPKLRFELNSEIYDEAHYGRKDDYSYNLSINYDVNNIIIISTIIWIDSKNYGEDNKPHITIDKPIVSYVEEYTNKINDKYFESIGIKGVEGLNLVKECTDYFKNTYKKEILKILNLDDAAIIRDPCPNINKHELISPDSTTINNIAEELKKWK